MVKIPEFFGEGSRGRAIERLLLFIHGLVKGQRLCCPKIKSYEQYDETAVRMVKYLQVNFCLTPNGIFGPQTLQFLKGVGFDFYEAAQMGNSKDVTTFVTPDGAEVRWSPLKEIVEKLDLQETSI